MRQIRISLLTLAGISLLIFVIAAGCVSQQTHADSPTPVITNSVLQPGPNDPRIAYVAALLLENLHYLQRPLDPELSARFFDGYINSLDGRHENFLQSDLAEFDHYRTNLDKLTTATGGRGVSDLTPAFEIFARYELRYKQHTAYVNELLQQDKFKFNTDERIQLDRRHAPFPKDMEAAKELWRQHLRYEYLQEKLGREITETNGTVKVYLSPTNAATIAETLARHYRWGLESVTNSDSDYVLQLYLNALTHAYDPHSDYFSAPKAQDFSINMSLSLFGIGATLTEDDGYCTIGSLVPGGPAAKSHKLNEKDQIVAVAQSNSPPTDVVDMDLEKVVQLIRGPKGTTVNLTIRPGPDHTTSKVVSLVRDEIKLDDGACKAKLIEMPDDQGGTNRIGVIDVPSFYATIPTAGNEGHEARYTSDDVIKLVNKLKAEHVSGIVLDLRFNPGGSLEEAVRFSGLFIKDGPVVQARQPDGTIKVRSDTDPSILYDGPMVVMINRFSASAAEIAAAALQDYGRALIVGDSSTHGKGTVQSLNELKPFVWPATPTATNNPGTIKISINKFYRVTGASTQLKGVTPDIVLPDIWNYSTQVGESSLDNPLAWDTIQPAEYTALNRVQPYLNTLHQRSDSRLATNQDYAYIREDIAEFQKHEAEKSISLNEHEAIKEREVNAARNKKRDDERATRSVGPIKVYDITLQNASRPGLPQPEADTNAIADITKALDEVISSATNAADLTNSITEAINGASDVNVTTNAINAAIAAEIETNKPPTNLDLNALTSGIMKTAVAAKKPSFGTDPALDETERILEDYISLEVNTNRMAAVANPVMVDPIK